MSDHSRAPRPEKDGPKKSSSRELAPYELALPATYQKFDPHAEKVASWDIEHRLSWNYWIAFIVIVLFFGGFGAWASFAPLQSSAIAPGVVQPEGNRRTVQHLEGGIIKEILVKEGDVVSAGDTLIVLNDTQAAVARDVLLSEQRRLSLIEARLEAEQAGKAKFDLPAWTNDPSLDAETRQQIQNQIDLFESRWSSYQTRREIIHRRINQLEEEIEGVSQQIDSQKEQLLYIIEELEGVEQLFNKGYALKPRLLALKRARTQIEGGIAANRAQIARSEQAIGEAEVQLISIQEDRRDQVNLELSDTRARLSQITDRLRGSEDILERTRVLAPVSGIVFEMRYTSPQGVIAPGAPILDIVPENSELLVNARVSPLDIDNVRVGLDARVILSAYKQRNLPEIKGQVRYVSADRLTDENTGLPYFLARIKIDEQSLDQMQIPINVIPGMPAEVMIITGERTMFDYLAQPVVDTFRRSFTEE